MFVNTFPVGESVLTFPVGESVLGLGEKWYRLIWIQCLYDEVASLIILLIAKRTGDWHKNYENHSSFIPVKSLLYDRMNAAFLDFPLEHPPLLLGILVFLYVSQYIWGTYFAFFCRKSFPSSFAKLNAAFGLSVCHSVAFNPVKLHLVCQVTSFFVLF